MTTIDDIFFLKCCKKTKVQQQKQKVFLLQMYKKCFGAVDSNNKIPFRRKRYESNIIMAGIENYFIFVKNF